jgi:hypothetical protein
MVVDRHGLLESQGAYDAMANTVFRRAMGMMKQVEGNKKQKEEKKDNKRKFNEWKANTVGTNTLSNWKKSLTSSTSPTAPTPSETGEPKPKKAKKPKSSLNPGKAPAAFDEHTHKPTKKPKRKSADKNGHSEPQPVASTSAVTLDNELSQYFIDNAPDHMDEDDVYGGAERDGVDDEDRVSLGSAHH